MKKQHIIIFVTFVIVAAVGSFFIGKALVPKDDTRSVAEKIEAAIALREEGNLEGARKLFRDVAEDEPENANAHLLWAATLIEDDPERALELVNEVLAFDALAARYRGQAVTLLIQLGKVEEASAEVQYMAENQQDDPETYKIIGTLSALSNRPELAANLYQQAINLGEDDPDLKLLYAQTLLSQENRVSLTKAKVMLEEVSANTDRSGLGALLLLVTNNKLPVFADERRLFLEKLYEHPLLNSPIVNNNISILRSLTSQYQQLDVEKAYTIGRRLIEHPEATADDMVPYVFMVQGMEKADEAETVLEDLQKRYPDDLRVDVLRAYQHLLNERYADAISLVEEVASADPQNASLILMLQRAIGNEDFSPTPSEEEAMLDVILQSEIASLPFKLASYSKKIELRPTQRERLLNEAIEKYADENKVTLTAWLLQLEEFEKSANLITDAEALANISLFETRIKALSQADELTAARQLLQRGEASDLSALLVAYYDALLSVREEADAEVIARKWQDAFAQARLNDNTAVILQLARLAQNVDTATVLQAYEEARLNDAQFTPFDWLAYFNAAFQEADLTLAHRIARDTLAQFPGNSTMVNNAAYVSALIESNPGLYVERLEDILEENPDIVEYRMTLALCYLKTEQPTKARRLIQDLQIPEAFRSKLIYAAVLAANNEEIFASNLVQDIEEQDLLPEERELASTFARNN